MSVETCEHCGKMIEPDDMVVQVIRSVRVKVEQDPGYVMADGEVGFILAEHFSANNAANWRELDRGPLRKFRPTATQTESG